MLYGFPVILKVFSCHVYVCVLNLLSFLQLFATPWTIAHQALLCMGPPRQEYWSGLPFPPPRDLPDPGIVPASPVSPAFIGGFFTTEPFGKPLMSPVLYHFNYSTS